MTRAAKAHEVQVALDQGRSYRVVIGPGLLDDRSVWDSISGNRVALITNATVGALYVDKVAAALDNMIDVIEIGDGETFKNLTTYAEVMDRMIAGRHNRTTTIVALGGGVVGDLAGFVAATYQRGVNYVQVPTTLLAQVDSSVGGKTAVNHPGGKNMIGAFYQPQLVVADVSALGSLPEREFRAGLAEVIKYGVIRDAEFFAWLEANREALLARDADALVHAVRRSCEIKAEVVSSDEREQGVRAILNFGHTFGHAIEALTDYEQYLHGEAVAIGMAMAADLSVAIGRCGLDSAQRVRNLVEAYGLPVRSPDLKEDAMIDAMGMDKKVVDGRMRFVVAEGIGAAAVTGDVSRETIRSVLHHDA